MNKQVLFSLRHLPSYKLCLRASNLSVAEWLDWDLLLLNLKTGLRHTITIAWLLIERLTGSLAIPRMQQECLDRCKIGINCIATLRFDILVYRSTFQSVLSLVQVRVLATVAHLFDRKMNKTIYDSKEKEWSGPAVRPLFSSNISVGQAVLWMLDRDPDHIGQVSELSRLFQEDWCTFLLIQISENNGVVLTNGEIRLRTIRVAQNITKLGYKKGEMFAIAARNSQNVSAIYFASLALGCPVNTLDPTFNERMFDHLSSWTDESPISF